MPGKYFMSSEESIIRTVEVIRYATPLREGGSLPALVEADDGFMYVLKFRGAGQGTKVLVAELIAGHIAKHLGLRIPEIVFAQLDPILARTEADEEVQDLLRASGGLNLALHYLSGAVTFDPLGSAITPLLASQIVWFDSLITNVDRTVRNTNMLMWHKELWLIDHGASLYFHHTWDNWEEQSRRPFAAIKEHVLLPYASLLDEANKDFRQRLSVEDIRSIVALVPDEWLEGEAAPASPDAQREVYAQFLINRLHHSETFVQEAKNARQTII
jgi:hypothetical protein